MILAWASPFKLQAIYQHITRILDYVFDRISIHSPYLTDEIETCGTSPRTTHFIILYYF